jgi:serine/threonine protein kinase/DNA-binding beta-propeller fold protein YncE
MKRGLGLGDVIADRFRLIGDIGQGGMGRVFEAVDLKHDRPAAVKVIYRQLARDPEFRMRFEREAQAAERANHPHVLPVWDFGSDAGHLFLATPLCDTDVAAMVDDEGPLDIETALAIVSQIAWALDWAHRRNVVHRDVKPENILIVTGPTQPHAYLADFGMAKVATSMTLTQSGTPAGLSPAYAAPEQWRGERATASTDQYALAGTLYCCLVGHPPFWPVRRTEELREAHLSEEPPPIGSGRDARLEAAAPALLRALDKDPAKRYSTCGELCAAVYAAIAPPGEDRRGPTLDERTIARAATQPEHPDSERRWHPAEPETEPEVSPLPAATAGSEATALAPLTPAADATAPRAPAAAAGSAIEQVPGTPDQTRPHPARWRLRRRLAAVVAAAAAAGLAAVLVLALGGEDQDAAGKVLAPVAIGTPTVDAFATGSTVWLASQANGTLLRVDAASGKPVGDPVPVFEGPYRLAGAGTSLWTISSSASEAAGIDAAAPNPKPRTVDLSSDPYDVAVGEGAVWILANTSGARSGGQLIAIDPGSARVSGTRGSATKLVSVTTGHGAVWVLEESGAVLKRVSPRALNTVAEIPVVPGSTAVVADSAAVWVANGDAGRLLRIDPSANRVVARIAVHASDSVSLTAGGGAIWWIDEERGTASRIDVKRDRVVGSPLRLGGPAGGAAVSGRTLWVTMPSGRSVARIRF